MIHARSHQRALAVTIAGALFCGAVVVMSGSRGTNPALAAPAIDPLEASIQRAKDRLASEPNHVASNATLATGALVKARVTADPTWYGVAEQAAKRAVAGDPRHPEALDALGSLALARHRFADALPFAERSRRAQPARLAPYDIQIDALIELGRYQRAFAIADRRLQLRPDLASYSRSSYAAQLRGERALATRYMALAADSGRPGSEESAWSRVQLGQLRLSSGDLAGAQREIRRVLATRPDDGRALAVLGHVRAAQGNLPAAERLLTRAFAVQETSAMAASLAEVQDALGKSRARDASLAEARRIDADEAKNGVLVALDVAGFEADWRTPTAADVARARAAHSQRPGIIGDDVLGWVLTRSGRCEEGLRWAKRSLRLGTREAPMLFHAGMAATCAGRTQEGAAYLRDALTVDPNFSVRWAPVARQTLARVR